MPRVPRTPGSGKPPHNGPARGAGHGGPATGSTHHVGYGGPPRGLGNGSRRAAPFTADTAREMAARAFGPEPEERQAARAEISARLLGRQVEFALDGLPDAAKALIADKILDRFHGRAPQTVAGDPERPQIIRVITGVPRPEDDALAIEID